MRAARALLGDPDPDVERVGIERAFEIGRFGRIGGEHYGRRDASITQRLSLEMRVRVRENGALIEGGLLAAFACSAYRDLGERSARLERR